MAKKCGPIVIERRLVKSRAFRALKTPAAYVVLMMFMAKRRMQKYRHQKRKQTWFVANNGEITFTYAEAKREYGLTPGRFRRALDEVIEKGFINVAATGMGVHKVTTLYSISERWKLYGTGDFVKKERRRGPINRGFQKGNQYGRNCRRKSKPNKSEHIVTKRSDRQMKKKPKRLRTKHNYCGTA